MLEQSLQQSARRTGNLPQRRNWRSGYLILEALNNTTHVYLRFSQRFPRALQREFIEEMGIDPEAAANVAAGFAKLAGFDLPLATPLPEMPHSPEDEADV